MQDNEIMAETGKPQELLTLTAEIVAAHVSNNSVALEPKAMQAATKWAARWSLWLQDTLLTAGSLW